MGDDSAGRNDIAAPGILFIDGGTVSGNELSTRVSGAFNEGGFLGNPPDDRHSVDAALDVTFVDTSPLDLSTEMVGTVDGTITSSKDGVRSLVGIVSGESGF